MNGVEITLFGSRGSNCTDRVRWALAYKEIPFTFVEVSKEPPPRFREISPYGAVPIAEFRGESQVETVSESLAILETLDELYPERPLFPAGATPFARAHIREICEIVNSSIHPAQSGGVLQWLLPEVVGKPRQELRQRWLIARLTALETSGKLWKSSLFAVGASFSAADILVAIIYRKAIALGPSHEAAIPELARFEAYWQALMAIPALARSLSSLGEAPNRGTSCPVRGI